MIDGGGGGAGGVFQTKIHHVTKIGSIPKHFMCFTERSMSFTIGKGQNSLQTTSQVLKEIKYKPLFSPFYANGSF